MTVLELLSDASKWRKNWYASTEDGYRVTPDDPRACCWCLMGALEKCYYYYGPPNNIQAFCKANTDVLKVIRSRYGSKWNITDFNDDEKTTFDMIKAVIVEAGV